MRKSEKLATIQILRENKFSDFKCATKTTVLTISETLEFYFDYFVQLQFFID